MNSQKIINNIKSRIVALSNENVMRANKIYFPHPHIVGLKEAIRIIESLEATKNIDEFLQTK